MLVQFGSGCNSADAALIGAGVFDFGSDWRQCNVMLFLRYLQSRSRVIDQCILFDVHQALVSRALVSTRALHQAVMRLGSHN